jgi:hypothetical protein
MGMGKLNESHRRDLDKKYELGERNAEHIKSARQWCKHIRIEMVSAGLLAEMSGLPIGSHRISCRYAEGETESMNLPWIVPKFLCDYCAGCPHHEPNGNPAWGMAIINEHERRQREQERVTREREEQRKLIRAELRELPRRAKKTSELNARQILEFIEGLFDEDQASKAKVQELLVQSAKIGAELFPSVGIDLLIEQSKTSEFGACCLPVCAELVSRRNDLAERIVAAASAAIKVHPEQAASVLVQAKQTVRYPLDKDQIVRLITSQRHTVSIGSRENVRSTFESNTELLARSYDAEPQSVISIFEQLLRSEDKYVRVNTCGALGLLQQLRPQVGVDLLKSLVDALDLPDDVYMGSADGKAEECIADCFSRWPQKVDEYLALAIKAKRPAVQEEIIEVYTAVLRGPRDSVWRPKRERKPAEPGEARKIALARCIEFQGDCSLEPSTRREAGEAIEAACRDFPDLVLPHFEHFLGQFALLCQVDAPPPPRQKLVLPGQSVEDDKLARHFEQVNRKQEWDAFKHKQLECLKSLAEDRPAVVADSIVKSYLALPTKGNEKFKSDLISLLGEAGKDYVVAPRVLPVMMNALMDYESTLVRASGIRAVVEMYRHSSSCPPRNVVDVLLVHLRDRYVIVHQSAVRALQRNSRWLTTGQAIEALNALAGLLGAYKDQPYDLEDICETTLSVSKRHDELWPYGLSYVLAVLPTSEYLIDEKMAEEIIRYVDPGERGSVHVAKLLLHCLTKYDRDRYNSYESCHRAYMFEWLSQIPNSVYPSLRPQLVSAATALAQKDAWESLHFASIFSEHFDFDAEHDTLIAAQRGLEGERSSEQFANTLNQLASVAAANSKLQKRDEVAADKLFASLNKE